MGKKHADTFGRRLRRLWRGEAGTQLAEMAVVLPLLLVLFGATAEFGRFFYTYATLTKATRSAARYLTSSNKATDAGAQNLIIYGNAEGAGDPVLPGLGATHVDIQREGKPGFYEKVTVGVTGKFSVGGGDVVIHSSPTAPQGFDGAMGPYRMAHMK